MKQQIKKLFRLFIYLGLSFVFLMVIFCGYIYIKSDIKDVPFPNEMADTLRDMFGKDFVLSLEKLYYELDDFKNATLYSAEVSINPDVKRRLKSSINIDFSQSSSSNNISRFFSKQNYYYNPIQIKLIANKIFESSCNIMLNNLSYSRKAISVYDGYSYTVPRMSDSSFNLSKINDVNKTKPNDIKPLIKRPKLANEGKWSSKGLPEANDNNTVFYKTRIRPDTKRHWAIVDLCCIDLQHIEMNYVIGTGYRGKNKKYGKGRIDKSDLPNLLCSFNAGFKPIHDNGGIITDAEEFLPLRYNKGTIIVYHNNKVEICNYTKEKAESIKQDLKNIKFIRQNQPILMENGKINKNVKKWGLVVKGTDPVYNWRSALGITEDGRLIYGAGNSVSAETLAYALKLAGCKNAMHLDMNISNIAFNFYHIKKEKHYPFSLHSRFWKSLVGRYLKGYSHDFFFITEKNKKPKQSARQQNKIASSVKSGLEHRYSDVQHQTLLK